MSAGQGRRRLWMVWLLLMILLAGIIAHEASDVFAPQPPSRLGRVPMFSFREPELGRIEVVYSGRSAVLSRNPAGEWSHRHEDHSRRQNHNHGHDHDHRHAQPSAPTGEQIAFVASIHADRRVNPEQSLDQYGLKTPQAMIAFYGRKGAEVDATRPLAVLYVGDLLPTQYEYYTMRDGDEQLSLVPRYYIALLLALVFGEAQAPTPLPSLGPTR